VAAADGSFFCLLPTLVSEAFGLASFGAIFGLQGLAPAVGSEVFATAIAGGLADRYGAEHFLNEKTSTGDITTHCLGYACYRRSLLINTGACGLAALAALWMILRQRTKTANTLPLGSV
jgi:hypothetical protein